jgi:hypothetical protein
MTDGPEIPGPHHVTDDERSDYDRHEDSNTHSTKKKETEDDEPLGKDGLIQPLHRRTLFKNQDESRKDSGHAPRRAATALCISWCFFSFFLSTLFHFLFFYIPHQPEKSGFALGHEEKEIDFAFPSPEDVRGGLFCCRRDVYSRRKHTCFCRRSYDTFRSKMIRSREPNFELPQIPRHSILS